MYTDMLKVRATEIGSDAKLADAAVTGYKIWFIVAILGIHFVQVSVKSDRVHSSTRRDILDSTRPTGITSCRSCKRQPTKPRSSHGRSGWLTCR